MPGRFAALGDRRERVDRRGGRRPDRRDDRGDVVELQRARRAGGTRRRPGSCAAPCRASGRPCRRRSARARSRRRRCGRSCAARRSARRASTSRRCPRCARASRPAARSAARPSRTTSSSSSVEAGAVRQRKPTEFSVAASSSARIPGSEPVTGEVREEARVLPVRDAREQDLVEVAQHGVERLRLLRRRLRAAARGSPRAAPAPAPAALPTPLEVVGRPVDRATVPRICA